MELIQIADAQKEIDDEDELSIRVDFLRALIERCITERDFRKEENYLATLARFKNKATLSHWIILCCNDSDVVIDLLNGECLENHSVEIAKDYVEYLLS